MRLHRCTRIMAAVLGVALTHTPSASANTWPLYEARRGTMTSEPDGLGNTTIQKETLTVDLRNVTPDRLATIEVDYEIVHEGLSQAVELVFMAAPSDRIATDVSIQFDGAAVSVNELDAGVDLPWSTPTTFPGLLDHPDGVFSAYRSSSYWVGYQYTLQLEPGVHRLTVRYRTQIGVMSFPKTAVPYHQFIYVLAPARSWNDFGELHVKVETPKGWHVASKPALMADGDAWSGTFKGIPADFLAVSLAPPNNYRTMHVGRTIRDFTAVALPLLLCALLFRRMTWPKGLRRLVLIPLWLVGVIAIKAAGAAVLRVLADDPEQLSTAYYLSLWEPMYNAMTVVFHFVLMSVAVLVGYVIYRIARRLMPAKPAT